MPTVVICPCNVAAFPQGGGHFWVYLQYVLGLRQLGCEVYWLEGFRTKGRVEQEQAALAVFQQRMRQHRIKPIIYRFSGEQPGPDAPREYVGMSRDQAETIFEQADLLLNFHYAISPELLARFRRTALVDIDPGLLQFWMSREQLFVPPHDCYFTISENVAEGRGKIADTGRQWTAIRPAISLEHWPAVFSPNSEIFSTISIWDSSDWVVDAEETFENTKRVAYLEFADLPKLTSQKLELALFLRTERDFSEQRDLELRGWRVRHSHEVAASPEAYQRYIQCSRGEFSCAKPSYIRFQTGWISDRTVCYLASGKPAVVQDTGPISFLPDGEGLFRFKTAAQAVRAFETINADYENHCRAARRMAEAFFDSKQTVSRILDHALECHRPLQQVI